MRLNKWGQSLVGTLVAVMGLQAPLALATELGPQRPRQQVLDRVLDGAGVLHGRVVDRQGIGQAGLSVVIHQLPHATATTVTDAEGQFAVSGLGGGVYVVTAGDASGVYRVWTHTAAPPAAGQGILLVTGQQLARGNWEVTPYKVTLVGLAIATGAVLYSIIDENDDAS